jgi:hypothetical protein
VCACVRVRGYGDAHAPGDVDAGQSTLAAGCDAAGNMCEEEDELH